MGISYIIIPEYQNKVVRRYTGTIVPCLTIVKTTTFYYTIIILLDLIVVGVIQRGDKQRGASVWLKYPIWRGTSEENGCASTAKEHTAYRGSSRAGRMALT